MPEIQLDPLFYVNVGKGGTFKKSGEYFTTAAQADAIGKHIEAQGIESLVLYFHGGLVSEKSGMGGAELMKKKFHDTTKKRHVVSFVWETGPLEVVTQNVDSFFKQDLIKKILFKVIKLAAKKLDVPVGNRGAGGYLSDAAIQAELSKPIPFQNDERDLYSRGGFDVAASDDSTLLNTLQIEAGVVFTYNEKEELEHLDFKEIPNLKNEHKVQDSPEDKGGAIAIIKTIAKVAFMVIKRYIRKTQHGFYPTIIEEILREFFVSDLGTWGWTEIKEKGREMFLPNDNLTGDEKLHAGEYFLAAIDKYLATGKQLSITLIGHSAGSIAVAYLMEAIAKRYKRIRIKNLFFLAPACRVDLFRSHVEPVIGDGNTIEKFRMFTMHQDYEVMDHCVPVLYTRSLLYMVSGLFEDEVDAKIMGLHEQFMSEDRYSDDRKFPELHKLKKFLFADKSRLVLSVDPSNPCLSDAIKHGGFDNNEPTLEAIKGAL
jgi:hypothetical protein